MKITKDLWLLLLAIVILSAIIYLFGWATLTAEFVHFSSEEIRKYLLWAIWGITAVLFIILFCRSFRYFAAKRFSIAIGPIIFILIAGACIGLNVAKHCFTSSSNFDYGIIYYATVIDKYTDDNDNILVIESNGQQVSLYCTDSEMALLQTGDCISTLEVKYLAHNYEMGYISELFAVDCGEGPFDLNEGD